MPIIFQAAEPIAQMQAAAQGKVAYEQAKDDRDFALKQQLAQQGVYETAARMRMARDAQSQGAYEFEASRQPSGRDMFAAQQHQASISQHAQIEEARFTRGEQLRMSSLERQMDILKEMKTKNQISELGYAEGVAQIHGMLGPLRLQQQQAQARHTEQANQLQDQQIARETAREVHNANFRAGAIRPMRIRTDDGNMLEFLETAPGQMTQVNRRAIADTIAERRALGGATSHEIEEQVMDSFRQSMPGIGELTDEGVNEMFGQQTVQRAVTAEIQRRSRGAAVGATLTENQRQTRLAAHTNILNRELRTWNEGRPDRQGVTHSRPVWINQYIETQPAVIRDFVNGPTGAAAMPMIVEQAKQWRASQLLEHDAERSLRGEDVNEAPAAGGQGTTLSPQASQEQQDALRTIASWAQPQQGTRTTIPTEEARVAQDQQRQAQQIARRTQARQQAIEQLMRVPRMGMGGVFAMRNPTRAEIEAQVDQTMRYDPASNRYVRR